MTSRPHQITGACWLVVFTFAGAPAYADSREVLPLPVIEPPPLGTIASNPWVNLPRLSAFPLTVVAEIDTVIDDRSAFGDTDRDGLMEIISMDRRSETDAYTLVIVERQPDNAYVVHYPLGLNYYFHVGATGDLDRDSKMEIVGQIGSQVHLLESPEPWSFPTRLAWTSAPISNVGGNTAVGDSDGDGRMEIIHSQNTFGSNSRLVIFENRGDDAYVEVYNEPTPGNGYTGDKLVVDLDQDGRREIALCGISGFLHIIESTGDDEWQTVFVDSTGIANAYSLEGGIDSDGNGRPELFVRGSHFAFPSSGVAPARVYEAIGDNQFVLVAAIPMPGASYTAAQGDLDGDGVAEYIVFWSRPPWEPPGGLWIYRAVAEATWETIAVLENPGALMGIHYTSDLNSNGRAEIFWEGDLAWTSTSISRVFAYEPTSDVVSPRDNASIRITPNPLRNGDTGRIWTSRSNGPVSILAVHDVSGRLVAWHDLHGSAIEWRPERMPAGVYFMRLLGPRGDDIGTTRIVVLPPR
jgi:hypothetical protein